MTGDDGEAQHNKLLKGPQVGPRIYICFYGWPSVVALAFMPWDDPPTSRSRVEIGGTANVSVLL